jgi:hypothetical protein
MHESYCFEWHRSRITVTNQVDVMNHMASFALSVWLAHLLERQLSYAQREARVARRVDLAYHPFGVGEISSS